MDKTAFIASAEKQSLILKISAISREIIAKRPFLYYNPVVRAKINESKRQRPV